MRTIQNTVGGNTVQSEVVVLSTDGADKYDARQIRALLSSDVISQANPAALANAWPVQVAAKTGATMVAILPESAGAQNLRVALYGGTNRVQVTNAVPGVTDFGIVNRPAPNAAHALAALDIGTAVTTLLWGQAAQGGEALMTAPQLNTIGGFLNFQGDPSANLLVAGPGTDNSANSTQKLSVLPARANAAAQAWTEGNQVPLS